VKFRRLESRRRRTARAALMIIVLGAGATAFVAARGPQATHGNHPTLVVPEFKVEPNWLKVPERWTLGITSSVAIDRQDHVWVLQRPSSLAREEKPRMAPPVLEFDQNGAFVQAWGGPGAGFTWPENEHGIFVDHTNHVWIGGQGEDDQILKFTRDGKFVLQIGKASLPKSNRETNRLWKPADMVVHEKTNELFVADGYGNKRVIVFDAATGAFKRMWGAFGNAPVDDPASAKGEAVIPRDLGPEGPAQFVSPVHAVRVSTDGFVYVADRGGRRVQVFTTEGKYLSQAFIGRECRAPDCGNGSTAAGLAFSADPQQRFLYVANRSQAQLMVLDRKTLGFLDTFGGWGSAPGQFGTLHHLSSDSKGNLYTAEVSPIKPENRRIQRFTLVRVQPLTRP
jgi:DNA-binding beta-propeller fold protein YncE